MIVGATDGIGLALARRYVDEEWRVAVLGPDPGRVSAATEDLRSRAPGATVAGGVLDVQAAERIVPAMEEALAALGQMDLLIYSAGVLHGDESPAAVRRMVEVNLLGAIEVLSWGADYFAAAGTGHLAAIGSVAGDRGRAARPVYAASKAGLHVYLEGLRNRLHPLGVRVTTIKPGWVRTKMLGAGARFPGAVEPDRAAEIIVRNLHRRRDVFYVPRWWGGVSRALRVLPGALYKRVAPP